MTIYNFEISATTCPYMSLRCCSSGFRICCPQVFNFSLSIVCVCPIYSSLQPLQITTQIKFLLSKLNSTLISNCFESMCYAFLMYWQQARLLKQFFTPEIELLGENELLHNILHEFGACHLQLVNLTFLNAFLI